MNTSCLYPVNGGKLFFESVKSSQPGSIYIYTTNYNVLRILSGMGGLAYSN